jgi:hypothetical protein
VTHPEGLSRHAAEGEADHMGPRDAERVEEAREIVREVLHRDGLVAHARSAVAPGVVAQAAVAGGERPHLEIPHLQGGAEGIREGHHRRMSGPVRS